MPSPGTAANRSKPQSVSQAERHDRNGGSVYDGPTHYQKAEELLGQHEQGRGWSAETEISVGLQALAHAALASAAAVALAEAGTEGQHWAEVAARSFSLGG
jgi:hypothetical protein